MYYCTQYPVFSHCFHQCYRQTSFSLQLGHTSSNGGCDSPNDFNRRVKFSVKLASSSTWTVVASFSDTSGSHTEPLYTHDYLQPVLVNVWLCSQEYVQDGVQFGWFQDLENTPPGQDTWMVDNVMVILHSTSADPEEVWEDDFTTGIIEWVTKPIIIKVWLLLSFCSLEIRLCIQVILLPAHLFWLIF